MLVWETPTAEFIHYGGQGNINLFLLLNLWFRRASQNSDSILSSVRDFLQRASTSVSLECPKTAKDEVNAQSFPYNILFVLPVETPRIAKESIQGAATMNCTGFELSSKKTKTFPFQSFKKVKVDFNSQADLTNNLSVEGEPCRQDDENQPQFPPQVWQVRAQLPQQGGYGEALRQGPPGPDGGCCHQV